MEKLIEPGKEQWTELLERPSSNKLNIEAIIGEVFDKVKENGDDALIHFTEKFDGVSLNKESFIITTEEIKDAVSKVPDDLKAAILLAKGNIEKFHRAQETEIISVETTPGVLCWQEKKPIQKVGLYIPGGSAPLFSTVLMLAIPAVIAGCGEIILCTPPNKSGNIDPAILYTADLCGIRKIFKVGGIQAIAGMTFGTETIPKVLKIFGPGNQYVTAAKQMAAKLNIAIDVPAGPSELLIVADDSAIPSFVASDLLSQAEHGADSQVILISKSENLMERVEEEINLQLQYLPRKDTAIASLANSKMIFMKSDEDTLDLINEYGPEHLIICTSNEDFYLKGIQNAGSVFIGNYTPESAGDYASGTNHTLPTSGFSKQYSGVVLDSFMKSMTFQRISEEGLKKIGPAIEIMAEAEGLQAHKKSVSFRLERLKSVR